MIVTLRYKEQEYACNLAIPIDISIPVGWVKCFYATDVIKEPVRSGDWIGSVAKGAPVNFFDIKLNPHGQGTHTECMGHITYEQESVNDQLSPYHYITQLVTVAPKEISNGDLIVTKDLLESKVDNDPPPALIIRTLPNHNTKLANDYSGTNPPYLSEDAINFLVDAGIKHLLVDLPSIDKEEDAGKLLAHKAFWKIQDASAEEDARRSATITELVYIPDHILDGTYLLNLQIPSIELDAVPSKPVIYKMKELGKRKSIN